MNTLVVVLGPTCVGKTDLCIQIAKHLNIPIINADSRQIYAELPIGTAAPTFEDQQQVFHYIQIQVIILMLNPQIVLGQLVL